MIKVQENTDYFIYLLFFVVGALFILIFSSVATPLTVDYSADSSIFMAMGEMFLNGKVPYVDFFDHKGPSLILIQALGQLFIPYRSGIFILEIVNLFLVLVIVYHTARILVSRKLAISIAFILLFFLSRLFNKGNTTEEFSLIPLFIVLYYTCRIYFKNQNITPKVSFIIGLCFSFLFWLRINNAGAIVACCIFLFVYTLLERDYKSLKNLILYFIIGQIPFALIYILYFLYQGGLYDMIYATFIFNFLYVESLFNFQSEHNWVNYLLLGGLTLSSTLYYLKTKDYKIFIFSFSLLIITVLTTNLGHAYNHYFILASPAVLLLLLLLFQSITSKMLKVGVICLSSLLLINTFYKGYLHLSAVGVGEEKDYEESYSNFKKLYDQIPADEKDELYIYEVVTSIYPLMEIDANYKYFVFQEWHGEIDENIYIEINIMMERDKPLWLMLQPQGKKERSLEKYKNTHFVDIINRNYHIYDHSGPYVLYKLNSGM